VCFIATYFVKTILPLIGMIKSGYTFTYCEHYMKFTHITMRYGIYMKLSVELNYIDILIIFLSLHKTMHTFLSIFWLKNYLRGTKFLLPLTMTNNLRQITCGVHKIDYLLPTEFYFFPYTWVINRVSDHILKGLKFLHLEPIYPWCVQLFVT
jgi:hypothetical protein